MSPGPRQPAVTSPERNRANSPILGTDSVGPVSVAVAGDIVVDRDDLLVEDRNGLAVVHALWHRAVRGADNDGAERPERVGLGRRDCTPHRYFVLRQRDGIEV